MDPLPLHPQAPFQSENEKAFHSHAPGFWPQVPLEDWNDWQWQLRHRITRLDQLEQHLILSPAERAGVLLSGNKLAFAITPHFFNLLHPTDPHCPIRRQMIPLVAETRTTSEEMTDPCGEDAHMPVPGLVHRYPDRVLFLITDRCASYCRYCTRSRVVSGVGEQELLTDFDAAFEYLAQHSEIRDVLLSGGDPLLFSDQKLEKLLQRLRSIPHLEFLRIGSRVPIFLTQRITDSFCKMLQRYTPIWMSIHTNHPRELTLEVKEALDRLANHGIPLGNQSVLLSGVNDHLQTMQTLVHKLLLCRVRPYYLYQCDLIQGSSHLRTPVSKGIEIIQGLRGHTTGYAVPQYVIDAPTGGGKVPIQPQSLIHHDAEQVIIQNYEGKHFIYPSTPPLAEEEIKISETCNCIGT